MGSRGLGQSLGWGLRLTQGLHHFWKSHLATQFDVPRGLQGDCLW